MSALEHVDEQRSDSEQERVIRWRVERLVAAGYDGETALLIAIDLTIDLHTAVNLVLAGCPADTALRILV